MKSFLHSLAYYLGHPLGRRDRWATVMRILRWQVGSRILGMDIAVPIVNGIRLLVHTGMHGATGNIYVGLMEFEDMAFMQHMLRSGDTFVDVGANVGVYSMLAANRGAHVLALEPVPASYEQLLDNIYLNRFTDLVTARNTGVGAVCGELCFSIREGSTNHVLTQDEVVEDAVAVTVDTLDSLTVGQHPIMLKIDVEGFETEVVRGASDLLNDPALQAILIELNGLGVRYGFADEAIHDRLCEAGFSPARYEPFSRRLEAQSGHNTSGNTLYVRSRETLEARLRESDVILWNNMRI